MRLRVIAQGTVPKSGESGESNADRVYVGNSLVGIADGVSQSYQPGLWAEKLLATIDEQCQNIRDGETFENTLIGVSSSSPSEKAVETSWYGKRLEARGGQSTVLWCRDGLTKRFVLWNRTQRTLRLSAVGDCQAFVISRSGEFVSGWPFGKGVEYPAANGAVSEIAPHIRGEFQSIDLSIPNSCQVLIVTDALGRYLHSRLTLENGWGVNGFMSTIFPLASSSRGDVSDAFAIWVAKERKDQLADDDTTFVLLAP
jgi:hypothetical protein